VTHGGEHSGSHGDFTASGEIVVVESEAAAAAKLSTA